MWINTDSFLEVLPIFLYWMVHRLHMYTDAIFTIYGSSKDSQVQCSAIFSSPINSEWSTSGHSRSALHSDREFRSLISWWLVVPVVGCPAMRHLSPILWPGDKCLTWENPIKYAKYFSLKWRSSDNLPFPSCQKDWVLLPAGVFKVKRGTKHKAKKEREDRDEIHIINNIREDQNWFRGATCKSRCPPDRGSAGTLPSVRLRKGDIPKFPENMRLMCWRCNANGSLYRSNKRHNKRNKSTSNINEDEESLALTWGTWLDLEGQCLSWSETWQLGFLFYLRLSLVESTEKDYVTKKDISDICLSAIPTDRSVTPPPGCYSAARLIRASTPHCGHTEEFTENSSAFQFYV